jgi:hypothetical protein
MLLYLRDHVTEIVADPRVSLPARLVDTLGRMGTAEPPGWFEQHLRAGNCVVLLDGLDEVARKEDRTKVAAWVAEQIRQYPRNDFVITSRPQGYRSALIDGAVVVQVRNFTGEQVTRLVHGWYLAIERHATGESGPDVHLRAEEAADDLLKRLDANPALHDLTVNPLLLTMIANVHRFRGALPGSRTDLYAEICQVMLSRRQEAKNLPVELPADKKEALLRRLAFVMMRKLVRDVAQDDLVAELTPLLRRMSTQLTEKTFLADVSSNGLLIERESGLYSFAHLTFQEYLAASYIRNNGLVGVLAGAVDDPWWRETTLLYATRADGDLIVKACLDSGSVPALSLAFDVAEQGGELAPEFRDQLDEVLTSADADPERRHLRNGVLVARQLRGTVRTEPGSRVCARPIAWNVYNSFLADTGNPAPDVPAASPDKPVTGVRAADAVAFVRWANHITGGAPQYRLPTRAEIGDPGVQRALAATPTLSVWLESDDPARPELWLPVGSGHPNAIDDETLASHVATDLTQSTPTLARLLLLRSLITSRALARTRTRARARTLARTRTRDRARTLALDLDRARDLDLDLDLDRALDLARALALARDRDLARALALALALDRALARGLAHYRDFVSDHIVMGKALSRALADTSYPKDLALSAWLDGFTRAFRAQTGIGGAALVVSLDTLADSLRMGRERLLAVPEAARSNWANDVAGRLEEIALPVVDRREPVTAEIATAIRIAALCLAAEADDDGLPGAGDAYRHVAAGVTLIERRASGDAPATETIMLATS